MKGKIAVYLLSFLSGIGGFLFGYDTGVISGAMRVIVEEKDGILAGLSDTDRDLWHELIVASTVGSAALFALLAGILTQTLGRKLTILAASVVFVAGSVIMGIASSKELLLGVLTVSYNTLVVFGQFVATLVCGAFVNVDQGWRYMLGLAAVPAGLQFIGFIFMPESPRWLLSKGKAGLNMTFQETV